MTLLNQMNKILGNTQIVPREWIKTMVDRSESVIELGEILSCPRSPDYVRMKAADRMRALGTEPF